METKQTPINGLRMPPHLFELRALLGNDVLLLHWPSKSKGTKKKWKEFTAAKMDDPAYLHTLARGNIGVALGEVSGGLCSLDIDDDAEALEFLELNVRISKTLRTKGRRGCNIWWRLKAPYPRLKLLKRNGTAWGEWRSTGGQTIIYGIHPEGMKYEIVMKEPPATISIREIIWPSGITPNLSKMMENCTERQSNRETEQQTLTEADRSGNRCVSCSEIVANIEEAVALALPTAKNQNHHYLFTLARAIKTLERDRGSVFNQSELLTAFGDWYRKATPHLRDGQSRDEYWFEFLEGYENALYPLGNDVLKEAWTQAKNSPPPPEAHQFESSDIRLLVGLCFQLQRRCGTKPFFLASRTVQRLFGHATHSTAALWLGGLRRTGILEIVEQGSSKSNRATRFRYKPN